MGKSLMPPLGSEASPETRAKMSASGAAYWRSRETKQCVRCLQQKAMSDFRLLVRGNKLSRKCLPCEVEIAGHVEVSAGTSSTGMTKAQIHNRRATLKRSYNMMPAEYDALAARHAGRCGICGTTEPGYGRRHMAVDHCHATGAIRGILCNACNIALGTFGDSIEKLRGAIAYLLASQEESQ